MCLTLLTPLLVAAFVSACCGVYEGLRPGHFPTLDDLDLTLPYSTVSFALSLLLVFKTNSSYARFWEGVARGLPSGSRFILYRLWR